MASLALSFSLLAFLLLLLLSPSLGDIRFSQIQNDNRPFIPLHQFGFTHSGHLELNVSQISLSNSNSNLDLSKLGFFLSTLHSWRAVLHQLQDPTISCPLNSPLVHLIYTFNSLNSQNSFYTHYAPNDDDEYLLFFANCHHQNLNVSINVRSSMYNLDPQNGLPNYLSAGKELLPNFYVSLSLLYWDIAFGWFFLLCIRRRNVSRMHVFMLAAVIFKALNSLSQTRVEWYIQKTGSAHRWINELVYCFNFLDVISFFSVIVLIGSGWSFMKPPLQVKEMVVLMIAITLQVVANSAQVVLHETGPYRHDWVAWNQIFMLADVICCCAVLFPIWWSTKNLRESEKTGGRPGFTSMKMGEHYFDVLLVYFFITRAVVYASDLMLFYNHSMESLICAELPTLFFYFYTGYKFRPDRYNPFMDDPEEEPAAEALELEPEFKS